ASPAPRPRPPATPASAPLFECGPEPTGPQSSIPGEQGRAPRLRPLLPGPVPTPPATPTSANLLESGPEPTGSQSSTPGERGRAPCLPFPAPPHPRAPARPSPRPPAPL